jgi:hypothetical protein
MKKYKVTLKWEPDPNFGTHLANRKPGYQSEVVVAESPEAATASVLSGYDFVGDARYPNEILVNETDEEVGLQPYATDYDYTKSQRIRKRRDILNEVARAAGWASWSEYATAVKNGEVQLPQK